MDDLDESAELCERHGLPGPAAALRELAAGRISIYLVMSGVNPLWFEGYLGFDPADFPEIHATYRGRAEAERVVRARLIRAFRQQRMTEFTRGIIRFNEGYCRQIGAILGIEYHPPASGEPAFPADATDEQMGRIADFAAGPWPGFDDTSLFKIVEIGAGAAGRPAAEAPAADDLLAGSDLCEEHRSPRQAAMLRSLAGAGGRAYIVPDREVEFGDDADLRIINDGHPRALFFDRDGAERAAGIRNYGKIRDLPGAMHENLLDEFETPEARAGLNRRLGAALGIGPGPGPVGPPWPFPANATDDQMVEVSRIFDKFRPVRVIEAEFGG